jgi:hypothetical protein
MRERPGHTTGAFSVRGQAFAVSAFPCNGVFMRLSEFWLAVSDEFGAEYGRVLTHDLVLDAVGGRTADQAIAAGVNTREIWIALCKASDVPSSRWYGVGQREPKK